MSTNSANLSDAGTAPRWQPIGSHLRRVAGVLVEKAKTVPDSYPMTLNAIITGCNQKNNRDPHMELNEEQVQQAIEDLRQLGAVIEVQSSGRVPKYKHLLYQWLGVDEVEMAVMTELLLRGAQTIGELRGRASRMNAIADLQVLQPILTSLTRKNLVVEITSAGRGQVVSHNLFKEREMAEIRARFAGMAALHPTPIDDDGDSTPTYSGAHAKPMSGPHAGHGSTPAAPVVPGVTRDMFSELQVDVSELRAEVSRLREELRQLKTQVGLD
ncbi:MAG: DUF480 domain-containing protein [Planctomycetes bacterium]|nr:DUF480 domain-containing protein [Planctomycetota bacterium]